MDYGRWLLISQVILYPAFCYMMTITYQTIGGSKYGLFLSVIRQGLFYIPFSSMKRLARKNMTAQADEKELED